MAVLSGATTKLNGYLQTAQHRSYFLIFATVVFVFIMVVFGVLPAYSAFTLQGEENVKRQESIDKLTKKLSDLKSLTAEYQEKEDLVEYFNYVFPAVQDQDIVLNEIMSMADETGVYLKDLNFKENTELQRQFTSQGVNIDPNIQSLTLSINIEGSQQTINEFLERMETKRRIYNTSNFNITRKVQQEIVVTTPDKYYNLTMTLGIYSYPEEESTN